MTTIAPAPPQTGTPPPEKKKRSWLWWVIVGAIVSVVSVVFIAPMFMLLVLGGGTSSSCGAPTPTLGMAGPGAAPVAGLNAKQTQIAATIIGHVAARKLPVQAALVALTVGSDESGFRNLANSKVPESLAIPNDGVGSDGHSVGYMQQQFDQGWGTVPELMNPAIATDKFLDALVKVPGWEHMDPAQAATTVQHNRDGAAPYVEHVTVANRVLAALQRDPAAVALAASTLSEDNSSGIAGGGCLPSTPSAPGTANIPNFVPGGPAGPNAVAAAASQMGIRYSWGGGDLNGPTNGQHDPTGDGDKYADYANPGWDCSALARFAIFKATGKVIARASQQQSTGGQAVPSEADARPGDLVFFGGEGSAGHVGVYMGGGKMINAPQSGQKVSVADIHQGFETPITFRRYT